MKWFVYRSLSPGRWHAMAPIGHGIRTESFPTWREAYAYADAMARAAS